MVLRRDSLSLQPGLRFKITAPYLFLTLALVLATVYLLARAEANSLADTFNRQLRDTGQRVADASVRQEQEQLTAVRALSNLSGLPDALLTNNRGQISTLITPYVINEQIERVVLLNQQGQPRFAMQQTGAGPTSYTNNFLADYKTWPFVARVLNGERDSRGDKYVGIGLEDELQVLYTVGPVYRGQEQVGAVLVGTSLPSIVKSWREVSIADVTVYGPQGEPLVTTLGVQSPPTLGSAQVASVLDMTGAPQRALSFGSRNYAEIALPFLARGDQVIGVIGVALPTTGLSSRGDATASVILAMSMISSAAIVLIGLLLARRIIRPITTLVSASQAVAQGNLTLQVPVENRDELGTLTTAFNEMVSGLRERERIRDILGRFVSPAVAELVLRRPLDLSGELRTLTIMFTDIRDFTAMAESQDAAEVVRTLNQYFTIVANAAELHGGLINKFGGDSTLVLFGLTDTDANPCRSARAAIDTALLIDREIARLNEARQAEALEPIMVGIGVNTGPVIAGLVGTEQRMEYTAIGDPVNLSARIQALTRSLDRAILISAETYRALEQPENLHVDDLGPHHVKGKHLDVQIYAVCGWEKEHGGA
jgi:class 3 adenylate cyclase